MSNLNKTLNFANFLSISRIFVVIPLIFVLNNIQLPNYSLYSKLLVLYIVLSDVIDGYFARRANLVTDFGKIIDPVADKICIWVILIFLIDKYNLPFLLFFILLSARDFILTSYSIYLLLKHKYVSQANFYGKFFVFTTVIMFIMFIYECSYILQYITFFISVFMLIVSTYEYIRIHKKKIEKYEAI